MTSDLVARARTLAKHSMAWDGVHLSQKKTLSEAADEIERLCAAYAELLDVTNETNQLNHRLNLEAAENMAERALFLQLEEAVAAYPLVPESITAALSAIAAHRSKT